MSGNKVKKSDIPVLSAEEQDHFDNAIECSICEKPIEPGQIKVRDHSHSGIGMYLGAAHRECNLNRKGDRPSDEIDIYCHNASGYDIHHIIKYLDKEMKISALPKNHQSFRTVTVGNYTFKDTAAFLQSSLDKLSHALLGDGEHDYPFFKQSPLIKNMPEEKREEAIQLLSQKGTTKIFH